MAGIYIHIPFCKSRCIYCDFYSQTNESQIGAFVNAICAEAQMRKNEIVEPVTTIYFGGGTPSRLNRAHFTQIFDAVFEVFPVDKDAEITIEANPDDLSPDYITMLSERPFNRISIGIQSFNDNELTFLSRRHTAQQAADSVKNCQKYGFKNISIDLMYGLPHQTLDIWRQNLAQAIDLGIQHISAYHLIYEEKTRMFSLLQAGRISPVAEELSTEMFSELINTLTTNNFVHYEISNFGKAGCFSRHNSSYWKGDSYLGLGPSAHSFDGDSRSWNAASLTKYLNVAESGNLNRETERLSTGQKYNEFILTGLRTMWGVDLGALKKKFGKNFYAYCMKNAQKFTDANLLETDNRSLKLTRGGIFISDGIISELMWVE